MIYKCKMCGGNLEVENGQSVGKCDSCGSTMTLPKIDDNRRANLYDRANHFRRNNEYDKAAALFENILNEDKTDGEAYWSLVLCKYGIEYVEDPQTHKRVPTCNRTQLTSILADEDYKSAIANADGYQKSIYEEEAKAIDAIQKGILEVSQKENPFDIFICYKETDSNGRRTPDSVLANDLYHQLTQEGFKVFFSRITLEDKIGTAYEPYIFAALQSAKVMVVLGTRKENFESVWVKNEWSRFLALIKSGAKKTLIPAYRDMDPYDLPEEFSHLQAQDMGKLGFMQDLIRGIKKLTESQLNQSASVYAPTASSQAEPLIKRAFLFLEDGDWKKANDLLEQGLNLDPENARAYVGKLMADLQVKREEELALYNKRISGASNFQKAIRFADENYRKVLEGYDQEITVRLEKEKKERIYQKGTAVITGKISIPSSDILVVAKNLDSMNGYKDSSEIAQKCRNLAVERIRKRLRCALLFYIADWLTLSEEEAEFEHEKEAFCKEELLRIEGNIQELTAQQASLGIFAILKKKEIENKLVKLREERDALSNGITKIPSHSQWMVIQEEPNRVLILKKECVGLERYHANSNSYLDSVTWQTCTLRQWLKDFYTHTFTEEQKAQILEIDVPIDRSQHEKGDAAHVRDKIFLLSTSEAERYLTTDTRRKTDVSGSWWLRSNFGPRHAVYVDGGQIMPYGKDVSGILGVRPALWLNLK